MIFWVKDHDKRLVEIHQTTQAKNVKILIKEVSAWRLWNVWKDCIQAIS